MQQLIKRYCWVALLVVSLQAAWGYAFIGPLTSQSGRDTWQTTTIGYNLPGDVGTPRNIAEGYRRNTPYLYYCYDGNFSGYFGVDGELAIDHSIAIMNGVTNVNNYSTSLYEVTEDSMQFNYTAQGLGLTDLGSDTLTLLAEQMGLAEPERYTWTLHDRYLPSGGKCPFDELYLVVQRNYDPITGTYSSYVNDILYSYDLIQACTGPDPLALAEPFTADPLSLSYTAVAGLGAGLGAINSDTNDTWEASEVGGFYTGLTRDDVAGLRSLYSTNNVVWESAAAGSLMFSTLTNKTEELFPDYGTTNYFSGNLTNILTGNGSNYYTYFYYYDGTYGYGDYADLLLLSQTLSPAQLIALYPGLVIASSSNYFILATNITQTYYYTNKPGTPVGTYTLVSYYTTNFYPEELYVDTFANVYTNYLWSTNSVEYLLTTTVGPKIGAPVGTFATNTTRQAIVLTNLAAADFFLLPQFFTNVCPLDLSYKLQTNVWNITNLVQSLMVTNTGTTSNNVLYSTTVSVQYSFTNFIYVAYPVTCTETTNATGWYQGIGHVQFIRQPDINLDPLTETFFQPITNYYTMVNFNPTNNQYITQNLERVLATPDVIFSAEDMAGGGATIPIVPFGLRNLTFDTANMLPNEAGPGTILPSTTIIFDKVGDIFGNGSLSENNLSTNGFLSQYTESAFGLLAWGTFDGSTNVPIVYPDGNSISNLQNQLIISISPTATVGLPAGTNNVAYSTVTFTASGGVTPYTFAIEAGTALPNGLSLSSAGVLSGTPTGATPGTYDFTIQLTDGSNRVVDFYNYSITIY